MMEQQTIEKNKCADCGIDVDPPDNYCGRCEHENERADQWREAAREARRDMWR